MKKTQDTKPTASSPLVPSKCSTAASIIKDMWGDWYGRLLLICGIILIPGAIAVALINPIFIVLWVNGLTAVMLLGRCIWKLRR